MNRRDWLHRAALIAGGVIAADQLELIERLTPKRYVTGWGSNPVTLAEIAARIDKAAKIDDIREMLRQSNRMMDEIVWMSGSTIATRPRGLVYGRESRPEEYIGLSTLASGT